MTGKQITVAELLTEARRQILRYAGNADAIATEVLLMHLLKVKRVWLYENSSRRLTTRQSAAYRKMLSQFLRGKPLAYLTGIQEFMSLPFRVNRQTLIPRPETEVLVEETLRLILSYPNDSLTVMDIGTGCGNIAVSVARWYLAGKQSNPLNPVTGKNLRIFASDISRPALKVARANARLNGVTNLITFCYGDLFAAFKRYNLAGRVDFILSNPPYVAPRDMKLLPRSVRDYEPCRALYSGRRGTELHERIIKQAPAYLRPGGYLLMEMGLNQSRPLRTLADRQRFTEIRVLTDYAGQSRVLVARHQR